MTEEFKSGGPEYLRVHEIPARFPVFGRTVWNAIVASGGLASRKIGRARIVRVADIVAFLEGDGAAAGGTDG